MLISMFALQPPTGLDHSAHFYKGHVIAAGEDEGTLEFHDHFAQLQLYPPLTFHIGTALPASDYARSYPPHFSKTIESYYSPENASNIFIERLWFTGWNGIKIPFKARYRIGARVLQNTVFLKGITEIYRMYTHVPVTPYLSHLEGILNQIRNIASETQYILHENVNHLLEYLHIVTVGGISITEFAHDRLDPIAALDDIYALGAQLTGNHGSSQNYMSSDLTEEMVRTADFADSVAESCWKMLPPIVDKLTYDFLKNDRSIGILDKRLATELTGSKASTYPFTLPAVTPFAFTGRLADTLNVNDPEWYSLIEDLNRSEETDFEVTLYAHVEGDMIITGIQTVDMLHNRFLPMGESCQIDSLVEDLIRHFDHSSLIWEIGRHYSNLEISIHRNFMEQVYVDIVDADTGDTLRQDYIDMASASLFGFGVASHP